MPIAATVFNIERFSHEDGPGIRTVVFMKGCSLRCRWCANPESQLSAPQILHKPAVCVGCGGCAEICPEKCIDRREGFGFITERKRCRLCLTCLDRCYVGARTLMGETYTVEALVAETLKDAEYFRTSGGGVTLSGGEPLLQADFVKEFADRMRGEGIETLVETCGQVPLVSFQKVHNSLSAIYYDFKHIDPEKHRELTGSDNRQILENLRWLNGNYSGFLAVRYPYIPNLNDAPEALEGFIDLVAGLDRVKEVWFLPYHRLGNSKYQGLGLEYGMGDALPLRVKDIEFLKKYQSRLGATIRI